MRTILTLLLALTLLALSGAPSQAAWLRTSELTYNTAHTLEQGETSVGLLHPLQYGISDRVQLSVHPVLVLIGTPNLGVRWRAYRERPWTVSLNVGMLWSLLTREDAAGNSDESVAEGVEVGFPGTLQVTATVSVDLADAWVVSFGTGPALDMLDVDANRVMAELHASVLWLVDPENLLMLHLAGNLVAYSQTAGESVLRRPVAQLTYAHSFGQLHLAVGFAVGEFRIATSFEETATWPVFPVIDLWWRL